LADVCRAPALEVILKRHTAIYITFTSPTVQCCAIVSKPMKKISLRQEDSASLSKREFLIGGETLRMGVGSLLYVPKGTLHAHRGVGEGVGRMPVTQTPGGLYKRFFEEVGREVDGEANTLVFEELPDAESIIATAAKYGIEIPSIPQHGRA
jgi:hypothetical protein